MKHLVLYIILTIGGHVQPGFTVETAKHYPAVQQFYPYQWDERVYRPCDDWADAVIAGLTKYQGLIPPNVERVTYTIKECSYPA